MEIGIFMALVIAGRSPAASGLFVEWRVDDYRLKASKIP
jgi:hypothetical protein